MLFFIYSTNENTAWCFLVCGDRGLGPLVDLPFNTPFINYPFNHKGHSGADRSLMTLYSTAAAKSVSSYIKTLENSFTVTSLMRL